MHGEDLLCPNWRFWGVNYSTLDPGVRPEAYH